jgi:spermidine synthase
MPSIVRVTHAKLAGVACISASILLVELGITRLFSVITWNHFAFLAVSLALFGLSASAVFLHVLAPQHPVERVDRQLWIYSLVFATSATVVAVLFLRTAVGTAFTSRNFASLVGAYALAALPFFFGGACITLAVSRLHHDINRVYGADLAGAAAGCLLFIPVLEVCGGPGPLIGAAALAACAAACFADTRARMAIAATVSIAALAALVLHTRLHFLDVRFTKAGERPWIFTKWNSYSRVAVYPETHHDWGLSANYAGEHPFSYFMDIDASASTEILVAQTPEDVAFLRHEVTAFAYRFMPAGGDALVIGPGGGRDLWSALVFGARRVVGVEINSIIVNDVMRGRFRGRSGRLYERPDVQVYVDDGRNFVARSREQYDVIQASLVDTWAATSAGAFSLTENNLYTVEAFVDYLKHLRPNGLLTMSRWTNEGVRVLSLARAAAEHMGWPVSDRFFAVERPAGDAGVTTFMLRTTPFTPDENRRLRVEARELGFRIIYAPGLDGRPPDGDRLYVALATADDAEAVYRRHNRDISPVVDDRPFFFQGVKPSALPQLLRDASTIKSSDGINLLARLLIVSLGLVVVFIVLPLALRTGASSRELPVGWLGYFACLGVGFMLIEIGLMQRFVLFLGHPTYALTVVLFTLLLGGAIGSRVSRRVGGDPRRLLGITLPIICGLAVAYAYALPQLFTAWLGLERPLRIALSAALLLPLGVGLGMPLPAGIAMLGRDRPQHLAWAWAINGATSVLGSVVAMLIALTVGFRVVVLTGAACYVVALLLGVALPREQQAESGSPLGLRRGDAPPSGHRTRPLSIGD